MPRELARASSSWSIALMGSSLELTALGESDEVFCGACEEVGGAVEAGEGVGVETLFFSACEAASRSCSLAMEGKRRLRSSR